MPDTMIWVLAALSVFTVSYMWCKSETFTGLRTRLGCYDYGEATYPNGDPRPETAFARWVACPMCMSLFPVSPAVIIVLMSDLFSVIEWLGIAGAAILMFRWRNW